MSRPAESDENPRRPASRVPAYREKYRSRILGNGWTPESFARDYPVAIRIVPQRLRAW